MDEDALFRRTAMSRADDFRPTSRQFFNNMESVRRHFRFCPICQGRFLRLGEHLKEHSFLGGKINYFYQKIVISGVEKVILKAQIISRCGDTNWIIRDFSRQNFTNKGDLGNKDLKKNLQLKRSFVSY
uniref:C2H2-type domain-containing protein n=1 Tax=Romanomermis culicivorax TaxID=13658 RepID=A0A915KTJ2_ROMCU